MGSRRPRPRSPSSSVRRRCYSQSLWLRGGGAKNRCNKKEKLFARLVGSLPILAPGPSATLKTDPKDGGQIDFMISRKVKSTWRIGRERDHDGGNKEGRTEHVGRRVQRDLITDSIWSFTLAANYAIVMQRRTDGRDGRCPCTGIRISRL